MTTIWREMVPRFIYERSVTGCCRPGPWMSPPWWCRGAQNMRAWSWVSSRWENIKRNVDPWFQLISYRMMPLWTLDVTTSTSRTHGINSIDTINLSHARYRRLWPTFAIIAKHNPLLPVIWSFVNKIQSNGEACPVILSHKQKEKRTRKIEGN